MDVSVAICTWNRARLLAQTLETMTALEIPAGLRWELIVVNNNCTDSTDDVIACFSGRLPIRRLFEARAGVSAARNAVMEAAHGKWLMFTDDDVLVSPGWIRACLSTAARFPGASAIGGPIEPSFPFPPDEILTKVFPTLGTGFCGLDHGAIERELRTEPVYGANMSFNLQLVARLRFNEALGPRGSSAMTGDDVEFVNRARQQCGPVVWSPAMRVKHYVDPKRLTEQYQAKWMTDWARVEVRMNGLPSEAEAVLWYGAPRWLWRSTLTAYCRWRLARMAGNRYQALLRLREYAVFKGWLLESRQLWREGRAIFSPCVGERRDSKTRR